MLTRKWFLTTVVCSGLFIAGGMANKAMAQTSMVLQPNSNWAVSKLEATQVGGTPYCALAQRFNNDLILTLARNSHDEGSVAIDFQKVALNNSQSYAVTLKPGFDQNRFFNVRPVSGKALVIRLGKDYAFHDALSRSGQLEVDISGESYNFNLPDLSEGQKKLTECLVNLVEPAAGTSSAPITPMPPQKSYTTASSDNNISSPPAKSAPPALQAMREENMRLRNALERERRIYEDRYMHESQGSNMTAEINEKIRILEMENTQLKQQLAYSPAPPPVEPLSCPKPDNKISKEIKNELSLLRDDNLRLKQGIAAQKAKQALLERQLTEKTASDTSGEAAKDAIMVRLRTHVRQLEEENRALKAASATGAIDTTSVSLAQVRSLEEQLRYVQQDRDKLLGQIESVAQGKEGKLLNISSDNWNLEQASRRFNEAEREIRRLGRELEEQRTHCAMEKKNLEYMLFDPEIAKEEQISKLIQLEKQNIEFEGKVTVLELEQIEYEQKVLLLEQDIAANSNNNTPSEYTARIAMLETELEESRLAALQNTAPTAEFNAIRQERDMLADQKNQLSMEVASLESVLASIQTSTGTPASPPPPVMAEPVSLQNDNNVAYYNEQETYQYQAAAPRAAIAPTATVGNLITATALKAILDQAQVPVQGPISQAEGTAEDSNFVAYSWDTGTSFGSAEQQPLGNINRFDELAHNYLENTRSRCQGDFAAVPVMAEQAGAMRVSSYEIACINAQGGASASVVFYNDGNLFTTIAHEAGLEGMDGAMDIRDRLVNLLMQTQIASR